MFNVPQQDENQFKAVLIDINHIYTVILPVFWFSVRAWRRRTRRKERGGGGGRERKEKTGRWKRWKMKKKRKKELKRRRVEDRKKRVK